MAGQTYIEPNMKLAILWEWKEAFRLRDVESDEEDDDDPEVIALRNFMMSFQGRTMRQILWCWESGEPVRRMQDAKSRFAGDPYITPNMQLAIFAEWQYNYYNRNLVLAT